MAALAPGFRFHPTDEELISYYLKWKVCRKPFRFDAISEIDIYKYEPWDLPGLSLLRSRDLEWYFFTALDKKYGNGSRTNRATDHGYWKTTGKDRSVRSIRRGDRVVGMKKTLVYHKGRAPRGERTNWVMHEYRLEDEELGRGGIVQDGFVLCRVFQKSGTGPKNGEQYGAPFVEEEWEDECVCVPKGEADENPQQEVKSLEYDQHQNDEDLETNHGLAIATENGFPPSTDHMYNQNQYQESQGFNEPEQKLFIGKGKAELYSGEQQLFASLEDFQMEGIPCEEEYFEIDELLNPVDSSHHGDDLVDGDPSHVDSSSNTPVKEYLEIDDLPQARDDRFEIKGLDEEIVTADPPGFEMLDEYLNYFDATDDPSTFNAFDTSEPLETANLISNTPYLTKEFDSGLWKAFLPSPESPKTPCSEGASTSESPKTHCTEGASSSERKPEIAKGEPDSQYDGPDNSLAKTVCRMLGSIPAPPAYAGELPLQKGSFGQTRSSSSIHVTAGMIHISDITSGNRKVWPLQKAGGMDLLLHYDISRSGLTPMEGLIGNAITPMRSGFFLVFLWVLILSVSYKIGSYIYTR